MASGAGWAGGLLGVLPGVKATTCGLIPAFCGRNDVRNRRNRRCCAPMRFFGVVRSFKHVACAHVLCPSLGCMVVCVLCACGSVKKGPLDPLQLRRRHTLTRP